jgi:cold shock CspA family protein
MTYLDLRMQITTKPMKWQQFWERSLGEEFKQGAVLRNVLALVDFFDQGKSFGFVELEGRSDRAYLHADKLRVAGLDTLNDGDRILCDVARGRKGPYVKRIHKVESSAHVVRATCRIVKLFRERGYGFVSLEETKGEAFFHISVFDKNDREGLSVGTRLKAEICPDPKGRTSQIRRVLSVTGRGGDRKDISNEAIKH